jgi:hypothetical protein
LSFVFTHLLFCFCFIPVFLFVWFHLYPTLTYLRIKDLIIVVVSSWTWSQASPAGRSVALCRQGRTTIQKVNIISNLILPIFCLYRAESEGTPNLNRNQTKYLTQTANRILSLFCCLLLAPLLRPHMTQVFLSSEP